MSAAPSTDIPSTSIPSGILSEIHANMQPLLDAITIDIRLTALKANGSVDFIAFVEGYPYPCSYRSGYDLVASNITVRQCLKYTTSMEGKEIKITKYCYQHPDTKEWRRLDIVDGGASFKIPKKDIGLFSCVPKTEHDCGCVCTCNQISLYIAPNRAPRLDGRRYCYHDTDCHLHNKVEH